MVPTLGNKSYLCYSGYGYQRKLCRSVTTWFLDNFLPRHVLDIEVLHRGMKCEDAYGYCDYVGSSYRPREFCIELQSNMSKEMYIKTLLHELVHLRQWVKGTLKMKSGKMHFDGENVSEVEYMSQPHEIEARELEEKLYIDYIFDTVGDWLGDE